MPLNFCSSLRWQSCLHNLDNIPDNLQAWLLDRGSLTARLKKTYRGEFEVKVLKHQWGQPAEAELEFLGVSETEASIREVLLLGGGKPKIFARSVIPRSSLGGSNNELLMLGNKPLGEYLFVQKSVERGAIELAELSAHEVNPYLGCCFREEKAWARRSLFYLNSRPLSVCEVFLPEVGGKPSFP
ncbi:chorismate lyase [Endozoicomonas sp. Mp262]|uniref:chorismate--pyruvate lyase family protein n=1 Tax=Endozoicomonas sp. Mp262 TaxID=2919499 RepID=UPI0021D83844